MSDDMIRIEIPRELDDRFYRGGGRSPAKGLPALETSHGWSVYHQNQLAAMEEIAKLVRGSVALAIAVGGEIVTARQHLATWRKNMQRDLMRVELGDRAGRALARAGDR